MKRFYGVIAIVLVFCFVVVSAQQKMMEKKSKMLDAKAELQKVIEQGKALFNDPSLGTTGMTCNSCHKGGGTKSSEMKGMKIDPFNNLGTEYPKYFMMAKKVLTLDQVVNFCITMPLKGKALGADDPRLTALVAYCASVRKAKGKKD